MSARSRGWCGRGRGIPAMVAGVRARVARGWCAGCGESGHIVRAMSVTIAVLSQKGGTGKTTMVRSLADVFDRLGLDTLAVDADPQGNLSDYFDADPEAQ